MNQSNEDEKEVGLSNALDDSSNIMEFESDEQYTHPPLPETSKVIQWMMRYSGGYIRDEKQANYVILGFSVLVIIISLFLIFSGGTNIPKEALENPEYGLPQPD